MLIRFPLFSLGLTSPPSRPTKKIKMAEEKNITSSSRPKKTKLPENVRTLSNLRRSSCQPVHQLVFSNNVDDPIKVEEMEDPYESSEQ